MFDPSTPFEHYSLYDRWEWPAARKPGKKRIRRPTIRGVMRQAQRAGVVIASIEVARNGSIIIVPGTPKHVRQAVDAALDRSEWN